MVKKQTMISTGIILSLLGSNLVLGEKFIIDKNTLEKKIHNQSELIEQMELDNRYLTDVITIKSSENDILLNKINKSLQQINNLKKENSALKKETNRLKKDLVVRKEVSGHRQLNMELTFYVADCNGCSGTTKTGLNVNDTIYYKNYRIVATDPTVIPLHSIIKIQTKNESYLAYAADTGGAIKGNILDVLVSSEKEAYKYGRQQAKVTILRKGK